MRKGLWIVAGVALFGSSLALAQDQGPRRGGDRPDKGRPDTARPESPRPAPSAHRAPSHRAPVVTERAPHIGRRPPHRFLSGGGWHRSIRGPAFSFPSGFRYQTWATGGILPSVFLGAPYFYDGYAALGLAPPPAGYQWVRYGPDLLLVNVHTGRIADTVDGVFY
ncbi:MAG TPA: RcnB family protein [Steroidobacteraceae bacterium]